MMNIANLSTLLLFVVFRVGSGSQFETCLNNLFNLTQSCDNKNVAYITTPFKHSVGFGSEFTNWLTAAYSNAIYENKRVVHRYSVEPWE